MCAKAVPMAPTANAATAPAAAAIFTRRRRTPVGQSAVSTVPSARW